MSQYTTLLPEAPFSFSSVDQYSSHLHHHQEEDSLSKVTTTSAVSLAFTASASVAFKTFFGVLVHTPSIRNKSTASLFYFGSLGGWEMGVCKPIAIMSGSTFCATTKPNTVYYLPQYLKCIVTKGKLYLLTRLSLISWT